MKSFLLKNASWIAGILLLASIGFYFVARPGPNKFISSSQFQHTKNQLAEVLDRLEILGFADTLSAQKIALKDALTPFQKGDYGKAKSSLKLFLQNYTEHLEAQYYLGLSLLYLEEKLKARQLLNELAKKENFAFREDAEWFSLLASSDSYPAECLANFQKIASSPTSKYQQAASAIMASLQMNPGQISFQKTEAVDPAQPQFAIVIKSEYKWWHQPPIRASILLLLPIGGLSLLLWKKRVKEINQVIIEKEVESRTAKIKSEKEAIEKERNISEKLLHNILPAETAAELKKHGHSNTKRHEEVTVLFCDFQGFTKISEELSPEELVKNLGTCFEAFDHIIEKEKLEKIKTVGDCYICAGGLKNGNKQQAIQVIKAAKKMISFLNEFNKKQKKEKKPPFNGRIGINTGPVVAGIVGIKKYAYDIWGDTVNIAARMEQASEPGQINISGSTYEAVKSHFNCKYRGKIEAKGKGAIDMYFIEK